MLRWLLALVLYKQALASFTAWLLQFLLPVKIQYAVAVVAVSARSSAVCYDEYS